MSIAEKARNKTLKREDLQDLIHGDDINKVEDGHTPLGFAVMNGDAYTIRLLLEHNASVTRRSDTGLSLLHLAVTAKTNAPGVVKILLGATGIEIDAEENAYPHDTPLMRALRTNPDTDIITLLKDAGASLARKNSKGETAEDLADRLVSIKAKEALLDIDKKGTGAVELTRFIVSAFLLLLSYLQPWKKFKDAVMSAIKMIYDEVVKPGMVAPVSSPANTDFEDLLERSPLTSYRGIETYTPINEEGAARRVGRSHHGGRSRELLPPGHPLLLEIIEQAYSVVNAPTGSPASSPTIMTKTLTTSEVKSYFLFAVYQPVIYCDDSGSMKEENRMASQASIVAFMSELMLMFAPTDKGVHLRFINKTGPGMDNIRGDALKNQLSFTPAGSTKIGNGLKDKVLNPFVYSIVDGKKTFDRPVLVLTITDGIPSEEPEDTFANMMTACSEKVKAASYPPWSTKFSVNQVGTDAKAAAFLDRMQAQSKKPEYKQILHVTADKLDAKYNQLRENKLELKKWLVKTLTQAIKKGP
ncbi:uncharacterized protein PG998_000189 [Apiospora kogelbergensis]|uniref:uncharacterized protein n=1 Tax=Apiospora kogelbergensis TaxID=1337665 RepID=UPI00312D6730